MSKLTKGELIEIDRIRYKVFEAWGPHNLEIKQVCEYLKYFLEKEWKQLDALRS